MIKKSFIPIFLLLFTNCSDFSIKERIINNYYIIAGDDGNDAALSYHQAKFSDIFGGTNYPTLIEATVFAVGYNADYIIAKQHPRKFPNAPDKSITNYYIVSIKMPAGSNLKQNIFGPLGIKEYEYKRKELNIPIELHFTKVFKELE